MKHRFHHFELDTDAFEVRRAGERVHLERRPMEALIYLLERRGELVTRSIRNGTAGAIAPGSSR